MVTRAMSERPRGPVACERCGCDRLAIEVLAWADYKAGEFQTIDNSQYVELPPEPWVVCHDCGHHWRARP